MKPASSQSPSRKTWRWLIGALLVAIGVAATSAQISDIWKTHAPTMPTDIGTRERIVRLAEAIEKHSHNVSVPLVQLLVTTEQKNRIPLYKQIDLASDAAERDMQELAQAMQSPQDALLFKALQDQRMHYRELFLAAVDELEAVGAKGTLEQFWAPTRDALAALEVGSKALADNEREKLQRLHKAELLHAEATNKLYLWLAALIAFSACLGAFAATLLWAKPRT